mmetsp:Transcript_30796/g.56332  ORF Transcript_30796/g.56332 Transcript_30796/m.56332 type:complete len:235 (-) Transcript_30796:855-1559(-)
MRRSGATSVRNGAGATDTGLVLDTSALLSQPSLVDVRYSCALLASSEVLAAGTSCIPVARLGLCSSDDRLGTGRNFFKSDPEPLADASLPAPRRGAERKRCITAWLHLSPCTSCPGWMSAGADFICAPLTAESRPKPTMCFCQASLVSPTPLTRGAAAALIAPCVRPTRGCCSRLDCASVSFGSHLSVGADFTSSAGWAGDLPRARRGTSSSSNRLASRPSVFLWPLSSAKAAG